MCRKRAGSYIHFRLKAVDHYNNRHTTSGAVKSVIVKGAGKKRALGGSSTDSSEAEDVICDVSYLSNGKYAIKCQVFTTGSHHIIATDSRLMSSTVGKVLVCSGPPYGANCRLAESNTYTAALGERHSLSVELFDMYANPTHYNDGFMVIRITEASVGNQVLNAFTGPDAVKYGYASSPSTRQIVFSFTPHTPGQAMLRISINNTPLPTSPVPFMVRVSIQTLESKLRMLRSYLRGVHCRGYTPTLTVDRERLLESAVEVLQQDYFSKIVRVRFGDEIGIDMGGITRCAQSIVVCMYIPCLCYCCAIGSINYWEYVFIALIQ